MKNTRVTQPFVLLDNDRLTEDIMNLVRLKHCASESICIFSSELSGSGVCYCVSPNVSVSGATLLCLDKACSDSGLCGGSWLLLLPLIFSVCMDTKQVKYNNLHIFITPCRCFVVFVSHLVSMLGLLSLLSPATDL